MTRARRLSVLPDLLRDRRGAAAAEFTLVMPLLLIIMSGSAEVGNYFYNEHIVVKAVRDGARFAARQSFNGYSGCTGSASDAPASVADPTKQVVRTGQPSGGTDRLPDWDSATLKVEMLCKTSAGGQTMSGIYKGMASGAPVVRVTVSLPYKSVFTAFGFNGYGLTLNAIHEAAVMGI